MAAVSGLGLDTQKKPRRTPETPYIQKAPETREKAPRLMFFAPPSGPAVVERPLSPGYTVCSLGLKIDSNTITHVFFEVFFSHDAEERSNADGRFAEFQE